MNIGNGSIEARREVLHQTFVGDRLNIIVFKHGFLHIEILIHQFQGICKPMIFSRQVVKANPNFFRFSQHEERKHWHRPIAGRIIMKHHGLHRRVIDNGLLSFNKNRRQKNEESQYQLLLHK